MQKIMILIWIALLITSCVKPPPDNINHACKIFKQYPKWYKEAKDVEKHWGVPVHIQLAIIHQESKFNGTAKPPRTKLLWVIPWFRPSTAYGYAQALSTTWQEYKANRGDLWSARDDFGDAVDFIGWYAQNARRRADIPLNDAYKLYLTYHEGPGGYLRKTYLDKPWLIKVAQKVKAKSLAYQQQLQSCPYSDKSWWIF